MSRPLTRVFATTVALATAGTAVRADTCPTKATGSLQSIAAAWVAQHHDVTFGLCVVILDSANHEGFACSGKPNSTDTFDKDTLFQIGSVTKTVTAALLARRVAEHEVALGDSLDPLLRVWYRRPWEDPITLLQLATHHSGLARNPPTLDGADGDFADLVECLDGDCLGSGYLYSNWAFQILGYTLSDIDGVGFDWFTDAFISVLAPLGMASTNVFENWIEEDVGYFLDHAATSHTSDGVDEGWGPSGRCPTANPSGCLYSSPHDMRVWLQYMMGITTPPGALGTARHDLRRSFTTSDSATHRQGLAWRFDTGDVTVCDPLPKPATGHYTRLVKSGDVSGQHAVIAYLEDPNNPDGVAPLGVVVMANSDVPGGVSLGTLTEDLLASLPHP